MATKAQLEQNLAARNQMPVSQLLAAGYSPLEADTISWGFKDAFGGGNAVAFRNKAGLVALPGNGGATLIGGGTPEQETAREEAIQRHLANNSLKEQNTLATDQRTSTETQATADRALLEKQLQAQLDATTASDAQRKQSEQEQIAAAEADRQAVAAKAATNAANQTAYSQGRTAQIDKTTADINNAYAGFDDNYYNNYKKDFTAYYEPQLNDQYKTTQKDLTYKYANQGGVDSSASVGEFAKLLEARRKSEGDIANNATDAASQFRDNIDTQRKGLINEATNASNIGDNILAPDVSDIAGAIQGISAKLSPYSQLAASKAGSVAKPTLSSLGNQFTNFSSASSAGSSGGAVGGGLYRPSSSNGSVRIIA